VVNMEVSIVINRPVGEVFASLADLEKNVMWRSGTVEAKKTSTGPTGVGTTYRMVNSAFGRRMEGEAEVTEYEPNRRYVTKNRSGVPIETERIFEPVEGGTKVTFVVKADLAGFFQLAEPLVAGMGKRRLESDVADLKDLIESGVL
jgi:carbon monoxide dehydrogenase subunit G